jgi:GNAT superfamily N-acetyltransferase
VGRTIPLVWDGTADDLPEDYPAILERGVRDADAGRTPNAVSALLASVASEYQSKGISRLVVGAMRDVAARHGASALIAPVRPTWKERYPITPIERYVRWTLPGAGDGAPFDPWLRVHWRLGAEVMAVDPDHFVVRGSIADWEGWAGMAFPESGRYVVPGALVPVEIDRECDTGRYEEPGVWMRHRL